MATQVISEVIWSVWVATGVVLMTVFFMATVS